MREISPDTFLLVEDNVGRSSRVVASSDMCDDDEAESAMASAQDQREEELQVDKNSILIIFNSYY